jgi:hypothetical protein
MVHKHPRCWRALVLFAVFCLAADCLKAVQRVEVQQDGDSIHISGLTQGARKVEIDDAPGFRTPLVSLPVRGEKIDIHAGESGLIPGLRYLIRIDGRGPQYPLRLKGAEIVQPGLDCEVLAATWRESGRFLAGVTYSQLKWNDATHGWDAQLPAVPIGDALFNAEFVLRPALSAARACHDLAAMDEIALYYTAMLGKSETVGSLLKAPNLLSESKEKLSSANPSTRTFSARFGADRIGEGELYNAQWLYPASLLLHMITQLPEAEKTAGMRQFSTGFAPFLVREQLLRFLFEQPMTPLGGQAHNGRVAHWELAMKGLEGPRHWDTAMSDIDLWLLSSAAEVVGAQANDPLPGIDSADIEKLKEALRTGVRFFQSKRRIDREAKNFQGQAVESACYFNGDYDGLPEMRGTASMGSEYPKEPIAPARRGASWDTGHTYRIAVFLRALYENRKATGTGFPQMSDLQLAVSQYLYKVFNGDFKQPLFHNNFDGSDGWFRVGYNGAGFGQPPSTQCDMRDPRRLCMTPGSIYGWGELSFVNPDLARLEEALIRIAFDPAPASRAFVDQHYFWHSPYRLVPSGDKAICGGAFYGIAAENAAMFSPN